MIKPKVGFVVYGVHKDGLKDLTGRLFMDDALIQRSKDALMSQGVELVCHDTVVATKAEAHEALTKFRVDDTIDAVVLFSGTWVWAAHMVYAVQEYAKTGKGLLIWTHPGSQGWRPVGGFVMHGGLLELGIPHGFVYGASDDKEEVDKILAYLRGSSLKNKLNGSTMGTFGGRGMGQTCGVADPVQWMKMFGVDIDSRDTTALIERAKSFTEEQVASINPVFEKLFDKMPEKNAMTDRSIRMYLALKEIVAERGYLMYAIQSFPGLGDEYTATCFAQSMMLDSRVATATLCDHNTALTVYLMNELSDSPIYYGDLQHFDKKSREMKIIGDGAIPPSLAAPGTKATFAEHGMETEGAAGGLSVNAIAKPGRAVLARIGRVNGEFVMVMAKCDVFVPDQDKLQDRRYECGLPDWPHAFATMDCDMDKLLEHWNNEYGCLGYGGDELYDAIVEFCKQTGIKLILP